MGGCCCCSSKGAELNTAPAYYYYPRAAEEHVSLSSRHAASTTVSTGLLVDTNLDTSVPDAYRPPPLPIPFDVAPGRPQTPQRSQEVTCVKDDGAAVPTTNSSSVQEGTHINSQEASVKCDDMKGSDCKLQTDLEIDPVKEKEIELSKSGEPIVSATEEEDVCPTCLEEYDDENPRITTKCEHHFHLACIFEWMERSDTCPVCDKVMVIDPPID